MLPIERIQFKSEMNKDSNTTLQIQSAFGNPVPTRAKDKNLPRVFVSCEIINLFKMKYNFKSLSL